MAKKDTKTKEARASLRRAFITLASKKPWLLIEAFERGLASGRPLGYLDLGARLMKEINVQEQQAPKIAIVFNGGLDMNKLRGDNAPQVHVIESKATQLPQLPQTTGESEVLVADFDLLEDAPKG